jgi:hypothetical protein
MSSILSFIAGTWYLGVIGIVCGVGMLLTTAKPVHASKEIMSDASRNPLAYDRERFEAEIRTKMMQTVQSNKFATDRQTEAILVSFVYLLVSVACRLFGY